MIKQVIYIITVGLITYVPVILGIAFIILAERKVLAAIQRREGPNVVGLLGLLQSIVDGLKLVLKENILPHKSNKYIFILSAFTILTLSLLG
jgi:NADH:ubiquinone oxidoreductase subunit H